MSKGKTVKAVKVKQLTLSKQTQNLSVPKTTVPKESNAPVVQMHGAMLNAIKQSPKGVLPAGLLKLIGKKGQ